MTPEENKSADLTPDAKKLLCKIVAMTNEQFEMFICLAEKETGLQLH